MVSNPNIEAVEWVRQLGRETGAFEVLECEYQPHYPRRTWDAKVTIQPKGQEHSLIWFIEVKRRLTPRDVVALAPSLHKMDVEGIPIVCCPYISPRVADILANEGIGYVDQGGNARIASQGFFLHVAGHPNPAPDTRPLSNPFSPKASRVVRLLLETPKRPWHVQDLAREADVSIGLVSKAKQTLTDEGYLWFIDGFLRLTDPDGLLEAWRKAYTNQAEVQRCYTMAGEQEIEQRVSSWCAAQHVDYALSDFSGAWRLAPMVRHTQFSICLANTLDRNQRQAILEHLNAKSVDSGANLAIRFENDPMVFYHSRPVAGARVLSPLQLYLDLKSKAGRGEEAADALYDRYLKPTFTACREIYAQQESAIGK